MSKISYRRQRPALTETQVRHRIAITTRIIIGVMAVGIPTAIIILVQKNQKLNTDFESLCEVYYNLGEDHRKLVESYGSFTNKIIDKALPSVPKEVLETLAYDLV